MNSITTKARQHKNNKAFEPDGVARLLHKKTIMYDSDGIELASLAIIGIESGPSKCSIQDGSNEFFTVVGWRLILQMEY